MLIGVLATLIGLTLVIIAIYNYIPHIRRILEEKLKISLFRKSKDYGPLGQIFYKYHHKSTDDWVEWIQGEESEEYEQAIEKLKAHIEGSPASWGSVTPEAIKALAAFEDREFVTVLKGVMSTARKTWERYVVSESCYEASCRGLIRIHADGAKDTLYEDLKNKECRQKTVAIVNSLIDFPDSIDINPLFVKILVTSDFDLSTRNHAMTIAQVRDEKEAINAFADALEEMIGDEIRVFSADDLKIYESMLNLVCKNVTEKVFDTIIAGAGHSKLGKQTIRTLEFIVKSSFEKFSTKQLYMLINLAVDELGLLANSMGIAFSLNPDEKLLCSYKDPLKQSPFQAAPVCTETLSKVMELPASLKDSYEKLRELLKTRAMAKQQGESGGIVLTGLASKEKLFLARIVAAEKKWPLVYGLLDDIMSSGNLVKQLSDEVSNQKPCVVYLDNLDALLRSPDSSFCKNLRTLASDPMIFLLGGFHEEADIDESGCCVLFKKTDEIKSFYPAALEITSYKDFQKNILLQSKLSLLDPNRDAINFEKYNILKPTNDMSPFEFEKYLAKYFRAALLVHGMLIDSGDFEKLDAVDFPERGEL